MKRSIYLMDMNHGFNGYPQTIFNEEDYLKNGDLAKCVFTNQTIKEAVHKLKNSKGPKVKLFNEEEFDKANESHLNAMCLKWHEVSREDWWDLYECLPPIYFGNGHFISEADTYDVHCYQIKVGNRHYRTKARKGKTKQSEIEDSLRKFIAESKVLEVV